MKYLVVLLIALVVLWRIRSKAQAPEAPPTNERAEASPEAVEMHACAHCGLHMPFNDMVAGQRGRYCSAGHRTLAEQ